MDDLSFVKKMQIAGRGKLRVTAIRKMQSIILCMQDTASGIVMSL